MPTTKDRTQKSYGRFYKVNGAEYPSVTTILQIVNKPALMQWAAKVEREMVLETSADLYLDVHSTPAMSRSAWITTMHSRLGKAKANQKELQKAADIGSQVHALIEWTLKAELMYEAGPSPRITDQAQWAFMAWEDWKKSVHLKPVAIEQVVWSDAHGYAGTLDLLAEVDGELSVLDWKTGKAVYAESHLQNAAYRHAIREMGHGSPARGLIVRLPKTETDPNFEVVEAAAEEVSFEVFLHAKRLWEWQQKTSAEWRSFKEEGESMKAAEANIPRPAKAVIPQDAA